MNFGTLQHLANGLTVSRILLIPPFMISFRSIENPNYRLLAAIIFGVAALTDFLDGRIARKHGITSFGKFVDSLADKLLVGAALICLFGEKLIPGWMVLTIMGRELVVTGLRVLFVATQGSVVSANKWGKYKATSQMVVIFVSLILLVFQGHGVGDEWIERFRPIYFMMYVPLVLTVVSGLEFLYGNRKALYSVMRSTDLSDSGDDF